MLFSEIGYRYLKNGTRVEKNVSELVNANYKVIIKCDNCEKIFETLWSNRKKRLLEGKTDLCNSCAKSGSANSQYGKDRKKLCEYSRGFVRNFARHFSDETKQKMSDSKVNQIANGSFNIKSNNRGRKFWYFSSKNEKKFHADSALEMLRMMQLDKDNLVVRWTKHHGIRIPYMYKGVLKNTVPDFLIETINGDKVIEDVKGRVTEQEIAKKIASENYSLLNNFKFVFKTQKELNKNGEYRKFLKTLKL